MHTGILASSSLSTGQSILPEYVEAPPPHISPFNADNFHIGTSYSQDQTNDPHHAAVPQISISTPPSVPVVPRHTTHGSHLPNSVLTMPIPGTKLAPEKFRGDFHKVKEFVQHYERLCIQNNVALDKEKCETLLRYCSKRERQTIQNIPSFGTQVWSRLRADILRLYDADLDTKRYKVRDVRVFSQKQKIRKIKDLAAWKKYCRKFLRIAGSLLNSTKISPKEYATYFWKGIPKALKIRIEN